MAIGTASNITSPLPSAFTESDPVQSVPVGMATRNEFLVFRNTFYWSKKAYAAAYPDYTKAKIYHWLHTGAHPDLRHCRHT